MKYIVCRSKNQNDSKIYSAAKFAKLMRRFDRFYEPWLYVGGLCQGQVTGYHSVIKARRNGTKRCISFAIFTEK